MSSMKKYLGGLYNANNSHTTFTGGFDNKSKYKKYSIRVGNSANDFVKNKLIEWKSFTDTCKDKNHVNYYDNLLNMVNIISPIPNYIADETQLWMNIDKVYNMEDKYLINLIANTANIYAPVKVSLRHLFMIYKLYIETLLNVYVNMRNKYIAKHKLKDKQQNFDKLSTSYNLIDLDNKLQSSSPILLLNFPPSNFTINTNIPKISWKISDKKIQKQINKFLADVKKSKFAYIGYCPHAIPERFKEIIKFPLYSLIEIISNLSDVNIDTDKCNTIVKHIHETEKYIINIKSVKYKKIKKKCIKQKFSKTHSKKTKIKIFTKYINGFLDIYKNTKNDIVAHEKKVSILVNKITRISNDIEKLSNFILITL